MDYGERNVREILHDLGHPLKQSKVVQGLSLSPIGPQVGILS